MAPTTCSVPGMTCEHCVAGVTAEVGRVSGVTGVAVDLVTKEVLVTGEASRDDDDIVAAIDEAGDDVVSP